MNTGINSYKKAEVICACENVLQIIEGDREKANVVRRILKVCMCCEGSSINLSNEEFAMISDQWLL